MQLTATQVHTGNGRFSISLDGLDITAKAANPSNSLCRKIMIQYPEYKDYSIKVCGVDGKHHYTIKSVEKWANKQVNESVSGISISKYKPLGLHIKQRWLIEA